MNILTIVALGIICVFGFVGHAKGFVKMLLSMLTLVATLFIASIISPHISSALKETEMFDSAYEKTYEYVNEAVDKAMSNSSEAVMNELQLPDILKEKIINSDIVALGSEPIAVKIATQITSIIFDTVVFIVTFIAAFIVVKIIFSALNIVTRLPIIHGANQIVGLFVGIAEGVLVVWIFFVVISMMGSSEFATNMYAQINESSILSFLYNNNIIMNLLVK